MRKYFMVLLILVFVGTFCSCGCDHQWATASCITPATCELCGKTEGDLAAHLWVDATCSVLKTCSVCGATEGDYLPHKWADATCTKPKTCTACGEIAGEPLGHDWKDATCTEAEICSICAEENGEPLGHTVEEQTIIQESTCSTKGTAEGICSTCYETITVELPLSEHTPGNWETLTVSAGKLNSRQRTRVLSCVACGENIEKETYNLTPEELEEDYKAHCEKYDFNEYLRYPDKYTGKYVRIYGQIAGIWDRSNEDKLLVVQLPTGFDNLDFKYCAMFYQQTEDNTHVLEDDYITAYGYFDGTFTGPTIVGASETMTLIRAEYIDLEPQVDIRTFLTSKQ
ncbi:MAG: hypothetical protein IJC91_06540 [Oscillospiraceae bacterium]|nr:hypothetical protein [Oscillospiraceae bacterium]